MRNRNASGTCLVSCNWLLHPLIHLVTQLGLSLDDLPSDTIHVFLIALAIFKLMTKRTATSFANATGRPTRPVIGVTTDVAADKLSIGRSYIAAIAQAGGAPIVLPCR